MHPHIAYAVAGQCNHPAGSPVLDDLSLYPQNTIISNIVYNAGMRTEDHSPRNQRIVIGMSGGVDSAVTAALLLEEGFEVHGVTLALWQSLSTPDKPDPNVHAVANVLGIPLTVLDLRERFFHAVVVPWLKDYTLGLTPNPCVCCNPKLKFAALLEFADQLDAPWIATGHYARITREPDRDVALRQARNLHRDQSYMLYRLTQAELARLRLPLGNVAGKAEVRAHATRLGLPNAEQSDSQDLCFLGGGDYRVLLHQMAPESLMPGLILDQQGRILGQHSGLPLYTIGQRSGLGLALGTPFYVLELHPQENALIVGPAEALLKSTCDLDGLTFISGAPPASCFQAEVRIRYRAPRILAQIKVLDQDRAQLSFAAPQRSVAPGQSVVFYQEDRVLGGGFISWQQDR